MWDITHKVLDIRKIIAAFFETLQEDIYVLLRIEVLVALVTAMFLVMFILEIFQFHYRWSSMHTIISTLDGVSDHIVVYLLGAMRSADFEKQVFPVWALVLVSLRSSLGYLSGYGLLDRERRVTEVSNILKFIGVGFLNATRGLGFTGPLWLLWNILQLRGFYRSFAHLRASKSLWHGRSSEFLPEYLRKQQVDQQKYLVYGETKQKIDIERPQYVLQLEITDGHSLITLDKIKSKCSEDMVLRSRDRCRYKDMCIAFYLSRLLRCRLEDVALHSDSIASTRQLIITEIGAERMFKILELELAFVRDYFYSLYPVIFWNGLCSLSISMVQSIATFVVAFWLAVDIGNLYKLAKIEEDVVLLLGSMNVDVIATWVLLFFMMSKEVWEILTYLLSNWTRLLLVCKYARSQYWVLGIPGITNDVTSSLFTSKIVDPWHRRIDQYEFFKSCTYKPTFWKFVHYATLGKTSQKLDGRESGDKIRIQECVLNAVNQELHLCIIDPPSQMDYRNIPSFRVPDIFQRYKWALSKLSKCSQSILVWNIATSLCEVKLAEDKGIDLSKPSCLGSVWSWLQKRVCCSSQQFLLGDSVSRLQGSLQTNYCIANSLSRYCGYLLAFRGELLPDSFVVPDVIFETTLKQATENLKECNLTRSKYNVFMALAPQDIEDDILSKDIVQQGARLAKDLINEYEGVRWEILAGVWTKLLVNTAPSWNAEAHKRSIESGGEFITLIWALLWHCGIHKSRMWPEEGSSTEITSPVPQTREPQMIAEEQDNQRTQVQDNEGETHISDEVQTDINRQTSRGNAQAETTGDQVQIEQIPSAVYSI